MAPRIGYLLPTRERIMEGRPEGAALLDLAAAAADLGYESVWAGDSLTARPRHEPLALLAAVAGRVPGLGLGTAVLLPALRNPVLLAHQLATIDQLSQGMLMLGVGIAADVPSIRAEFGAVGVPFEKRVGRMLEGLRLCRALWGGGSVSWSGRWELAQAGIGPTPFRAGGPPILIGGNGAPALARAGGEFDGWLPIAPGPDGFARGWTEIAAIARAAGRDSSRLTGAMYLTVSLDEDAAEAEARLDRYMEAYYSQPSRRMRAIQAHYAGGLYGLAALLDAYAKAGADHLILRFAGRSEQQMQVLPRLRQRLGW